VTRVFVGAGSNVEPRERLRAAVVALERSFGAVSCSAVFQSAAVGVPAPDYFNVAVAFDTERGADELKLELVAIETAAGRSRAEPRTALCPIDLDLLIYGSCVDAQRRLPHPDILRRAFVLAPLAELAPELAHPVSGERLASAASRLAESARAVRRIGRLEELT
jgi:2-amino-4-hydroxy-6-hydroxymethyldihydropteridine diphosphokinase